MAQTLLSVIPDVISIDEGICAILFSPGTRGSEHELCVSMARKLNTSQKPAPMSRLERRRSDSESTSPSTLRALVVEDDPDYRTFIAALLQRLDFDVIAVASGQEALQQLDAHPDLMVIDCEMSGMSGLEVIAEVRAHQQGADVYTVMLTGRDDLETKIVALRAGFDDFLQKATPDVEIVARLGATRRLILRQHRLDFAVRELYGLATRDELTGLFNRRYFFADAERLLAEHAGIHLVLFDLDDFKSINDTYGHLAGDRILRDVGQLFLRSTRQTDMFSRYGGDEFVLLIRGTTIEEVDAVAARIAADVSTLEWRFDHQHQHIGISTGIATSSLLEEPTVAKLLNVADRDLYKNKWLRAHPSLDPLLYEYPASRANSRSEVLEFPAKTLDGQVRKGE